MRNRIELIINTFKESKKVSKKEFAESIGLSPSVIGDFLYGRLKSISTEAVSSIYKVYNVNPTWLLTGEGEMFVSDLPTNTIPLLSRRDRIIEALPESERDEIDTYIEYRASRSGVDTSKIKDAHEVYAAPVTTDSKALSKPAKPLIVEAEILIYGRIAAGVPFFAEENIEGRVKVPADRLRGKQQDNLFGLKVSGMSMMGVNIYDGDTAILEKIISAKDQVNDGDIVAALINNESTLKRIFFVGERIEFRAENPEFKTIVVSDKDSVLIQGRWILTLWGGFKRVKEE
jgi:SOS-response transcriptional repressor LexA